MNHEPLCMDDEMTRLFIVVRIRPRGVVILTRRSHRIEMSLGGLSEDVVNGLSKLCRGRWNIHSRLRGGLAR